MKNIYTKWHKIMPLFEADQVYFTSIPDKYVEHWDCAKPNKEAFKTYINEASNFPKFVSDPELLSLVDDTTNWKQSLFDMQRCGVLHLPFPNMIVELPLSPHEQLIVVMSEVKDLSKLKSKWHPLFKDQVPPFFLCCVLRVIIDGNGKQEFLCIAPAIQSLSLYTDPKDDHRHIQYRPIPFLFFTWSNTMEASILSTAQQDSLDGWWALKIAFLVMATAGVEKEVVEVTKLNKKREASGKALIPKHTFIRIGHVYRTAGSDEKVDYDPRRSPRPHWRRGHIRMQRFGKAWASYKEVYINPKLVAYKGDGEPSPHDYVVTQ